MPDDTEPVLIPRRMVNAVADGRACVMCGREDGRPMRPSGFGPGGQLFRHEECRSTTTKEETNASIH